MKKRLFTSLVLLLFLVLISSGFASTGNRVNFEIRNRVANDSTYSVELWAIPDPSVGWDIGSCNVYFLVNPQAFNIYAYPLDTLASFGTIFNVNGYSKPWQYAVPNSDSLVELNWIAPLQGPFTNIKTPTYLFTFNLRIVNDTLLDNIRLDETSAIVYNDYTLPLDPSCGNATCYGYINPTPQRIRALNTISTGTLSNTVFCAGTSVQVPFTISGTFNTGNIFTAQLSDANGSFANPVAIGTLAQTTAGTINTTIPANALQGNNYKIRVVSSNPVVTGGDNNDNITVNALPTAYTLPSTINYCPNSDGCTITLANSEVGTSYQLLENNAAIDNPIAGTGSSISWYNKTVGTYTITATRNSCSVDMNNSISVQQYPAPQHFNFTANAASYCAGADGVILTLSGSENQATYTLMKDGVQAASPVNGTGAALTWNNVTKGNYTVTINTNSGCTVVYNDTLKIKENALPTAFTLSGISSVCSGSTSTLTLSGSELGVNYQLMKDNANVQSALAGTGSPLTWTISENGSYKVVATNANSCSANMNGTIGVEFHAAPTHFALSSSASSYCSNSNGVDILLAGSEANFSYSIYKDNVQFGDALNGTGSSLSWSNAKAGHYTLKVTDLFGGCPVFFNDTVKITEDAAPLAFNFTGTASICEGDTAVLRLSGSQLNMAYELFKNNLPYQGPVVGTGDALTWKVSEAGIYKVAAGISMTCYTKMNGNDTITVNPRPAQYSILGGGEYCPGSVASITTSGSENNVMYSLIFNNQVISSHDGTGNSLSFPINVVAGTYSMTATNKTTGCTTDLGTVSIQAAALPQKFNLSADVDSICQNSDVILTLSGSENDVSYGLYNNNELIEEKPGTGNAISWQEGNGGVYTVSATKMTNSCPVDMNDTVSVFQKPAPIMSFSGEMQPVKFSTVKYINTYPGINHWSVTGGTLLSAQTADTAIVQWGNIGTGILFNRKTLNGCVDSMYVGINIIDYNTPSRQARNIIFTNIKTNQITVNWTRGNGDSVLVVVSRGDTVAVPNQGSSYTANSVLGQGDIINDSTYAVYTGTGRNVTITGLDASTYYTFKVYEYYQGGYYCVNISSANPRSRMTMMLPPTNLRLATQYSKTQEGGNVRWNFDGDVDFFDLQFATDSNFTNVVWDGDVGSLNQATVTSLNPETVYYGRVKAYSGYINSDWSNTLSFQTLAPLSDTLTLTITNGIIRDSSIYVSWQKTKPAKILILARPINPEPSGNVNMARFSVEYGKEYIANSNFANAPMNEDGTKAVFLGDADSVTVTGLTPDTRYEVYFFAVTGTQSTSNYLGPLIHGDLSTLPTFNNIPPSNLVAHDITNTSFNLAWDNDLANGTIFLMNRDSLALLQDTLNSMEDYYDIDDELPHGSVVVSVSGQAYPHDVSIRNLDANTKYYIKACSFIESRYSIYYNNNPYALISVNTLADEPGTIVDNLNFSNIMPTSFNVNYTKAAGTDNVLVLANTEDNFGTPEDGIEYQYNSDYNLAPSFDGGGKVIYSGSNETFNLSSLLSNTTYYVRVYSFNGNGTAVNYLNDYYAQNTCTTLQEGPSVSPTNVVRTYYDETVSSFKWNKGNGQYSIVLIGNANATGNPVNGNVYNADTNYVSQTSSAIGDFKVAYIGTDSVVNIHNLPLASNYLIKVYTFDNNGNGTKYNKTAASMAFSTLSVAPESAPTNLSAQSTSPASIHLSWTTAGTGTIVLASPIKDFSISPKDATVYVASNDYSNQLSSVINNAKVVVFAAGASSADITGLQANTKYYFAHYSFNGMNDVINYNETPAIDSAVTWQGAPTVAPSNLQFDNIERTSARITWTKGNGASQIVLLSEAQAPNTNPVNGTAYAANSNYSNANSSVIGNAKVIAIGDTNSVVVTGLISGRTYYASVYTFNGNDNQTQYNSNGLTNSFVTFSTVSKLAFSSVPAIVIPNQLFNLVVETRNASNQAAPVSSPVNIRLNLTSGSGVLLGTVDATIPANYSSFAFNNLVYQTTGTETSISVSVVDVDNVLSSASTGSIVLEGLAPTIQDKIIYFTNVTPSSMTINWSAGNGSSRIMVASQGAALNTLPSDRTNYLANSMFGQGDQIGNGYVVYNGTGHTVNVTGLTSGQTYHFRAFGYNGTGTGIKYNTSSATFNPKNRTMAKAGMLTPDEDGTIAGMLPSNFNMTQILPNPVKNNVNFTLNNLTEQGLSVVVYDMTGRVVVNYQKAKLMSVGSYEINIPLDNISAGTYILQIDNGDEVAVQKFVVLP